MIITVAGVTVVYKCVPKAGSTAVKQALETLAAGKRVRGDPHERCPCLPFYPERGDWTFTVVRDPIDRFVSAYNDICRLRGCGRYETVNELANALVTGQVTDAEIIHHTAPFVRWVGCDPAYYDRIYDLTELKSLEMDFGSVVGLPIAFGSAPRHSSRIERASRHDLDSTRAAQLMEFYANDYYFMDRRGWP